MMGPMGNPAPMPMMPPPGMAPMPAAGQTADIHAVLAQLRDQYGVPAPRTPTYRRGYKPPKKPEIERIWASAMRARLQHQWLINRMYFDLMWLRMALVGTFPEDVEAKHAGLLIDEHRSPAMAAEWETFCGFLASLPLAPKKVIRGEDGQSLARMMQDAANYFLEQEAYRWEEGGNGTRRQEEVKYLTSYGRIIDRTTPNLKDPEYPFRDALIDPTTFFPRFLGDELARAYHVYRAPLERVLAAYNDIPEREYKKITNKYGERWYEEETQTEVVEYWDTWWRSVQCGEVVILPVTAHQYGETPFTVGYGPSGEPMGSHAPPAAARWDSSGEMIRETGSLYDDQVHKGLSYIHYMRVEHEQYEAIMSRLITAMKKQVDPPTTLEQSNEAAQRERPELDTTPGAINELILGEQKWNPIPTSPTPMDVQNLMNGLMADRMRTRMPDAFFGGNDKSNVSGTAIGNMSDAGMEKAGRWVFTLERWHGRRYTRKFRFYHNIGWQAAYVDSEPTPLIIPMSRPINGKRSFELTPEMLDKIGPMIDMKMTRARKDQYNALAQAGKVFNDMGVVTKAQIAEWLGEYNYDVIEEEWLEEKSIELAMSNPDFATMFVIPAMIENLIKESAGNPRRAEGLRRWLLAWQQKMTAPLEQQMQMQQQPQGMPGTPGAMPQGAIPGGNPLASPQGDPNVGGGSPGVAGNMSYPAIGQGPGSVTGVQGGPRGPR